MSEVLPLAQYRKRNRRTAVGSGAKAHQIFFDRDELNRILSLYSQRVIAGEWRDYAIELERDGAVFAIYRRTCDGPIYRIVKRARAALRPTRYLVTAGGRVLRYGRSLDSVIEVLERPRPRLVEPV
jgi:hypothetical protein